MKNKITFYIKLIAHVTHVYTSECTRIGRHKTYMQDIYVHVK